MDLCLPADFFHATDGHRAYRDDLDPTLGADAHVHLDASAFVTGLRDWRRTPATSLAQAVHIVDSEWSPL
jgi:hypothetical protein